MTDSWEVQGEWWVPETPEYQVHGSFSWSSQDAGLLRLNGQVVPDEWFDHTHPVGAVQRRRRRAEMSDPLPLLHGKSGDGSFTLLHSFRTAQRNIWSDRPTEEICVNAVVDGAWFDAVDVAVDQVSFRVRDLLEWVDISGIQADHPRERGKVSDTYARVTAKRLPQIDIPLSEGTLTLVQCLSTEPEGIARITVTQDWVLEIARSEPAPLQTFFAVASDLQDLISISTGRPAEFGEVRLRHPDLRQVNMSGEDVGRRSVRYFGRWSARAESTGARGKARRLLPAQMLFSLPDLGAEGLQRWMSSAERYRTELGRAMATRYATSMFVEDRIMNLCGVLDSFGRERVGRKGSFRERLRCAVRLAGDPFSNIIVVDAETWIREVTIVRNEIAHHGGDLRTDTKVGDPLLAHQLFWLFVLCLLRDAQAPAAVFGKILRHRTWHWMRQQAEKARPPASTEDTDS